MRGNALDVFTGWRRSMGFTVLCTQGALGEWFTVIPGSPDKATELRRQGIASGVSLTSREVRGQLLRLGLATDDIDEVITHARRWSTTISAAEPASRLRRLLFH